MTWLYSDHKTIGLYTVAFVAKQYSVVHVVRWV